MVGWGLREQGDGGSGERRSTEQGARGTARRDPEQVGHDNELFGRFGLN